MIENVYQIQEKKKENEILICNLNSSKSSLYFSTITGLVRLVFLDVLIWFVVSCDFCNSFEIFQSLQLIVFVAKEVAKMY